MSKYPTTSQEKEWIAVTKAGDGAAFSHIIEKYQQPVYNLCYHMLRDSAEAEDATQETFLRAYTKLDSYDDRRTFSTWLFSIASHYCLDKLKRPRVNLISWDMMLFGQPGDSTFQPEKLWLKQETDQEVRGLLRTLPPDYQMAVILKYWHAMPYQEIAEILNSTVSAIKSKLFRARRMMADAATQKQSVRPPVVEGALSFAT